MTLREAMLTGKPLRRIYNKEWFSPFRMSVISTSKGIPQFFAPFLSKPGDDYAISWDDILSDDWEVEGE